MDQFEDAADTAMDRISCLEQFESLARTAGDDGRAQKALSKIANGGCSEDAECARNLIWVAQEEEATGNPGKALTFYKRAFDRNPADDAPLESSARLSAKVGLHAEAAEGYQRLGQRHPDDPRWPNAAAEQRQLAMKEALKL